jgi:hypothetical protein
MSPEGDGTYEQGCGSSSESTVGVRFLPGIARTSPGVVVSIVNLRAWPALLAVSLQFACGAAQTGETPAFLPREAASVSGPFYGVTPAAPKDGQEGAPLEHFALRGSSYAPATLIRPGYVRFADGEEEAVPEVLREAQGGDMYVEWNATYWRAEVSGSSSDQGVPIHYVGWGPEYDETVAWSRVKYLAIEPRR